MPRNKRYLIDADVLIASKNLYYRPAFCTAFWSWIEAGHRAGQFFSIDKVKKELLAGNKEDPLADWAGRPGLSHFFLPSTAGASKWTELSRWAVRGSFLPAAKDKFLKAESADAWLIAYAAHSGDCTIVTNEVPAPQSRKSIKLPDAAAVLHVPTISLFDLLHGKAAGTFNFVG